MAPASRENQTSLARPFDPLERTSAFFTAPVHSG